MPLKACIMFLKLLKREVGARGPDYNDDLKGLYGYFGNRMSEWVKAVIILYNLMNYELKEYENDARKLRSERKYQTSIEEALDFAIEEQEYFAELEEHRDGAEISGKLGVLPPDSVLDRCERYRCTNDRRVSRLLQNVETVRRLRGET
jgi:hypothetical protein